MILYDNMIFISFFSIVTIILKIGKIVYSLGGKIYETIETRCIYKMLIIIF